MPRLKLCHVARHYDRVGLERYPLSWPSSHNLNLAQKGCAESNVYQPGISCNFVQIHEKGEWVCARFTAYKLRCTNDPKGGTTPDDSGIECGKQPHVRKTSEGLAVNQGRDATSVVGTRLIDPP